MLLNLVEKLRGGEIMDSKTIQDIFFVALYPVWIFITLILAIIIAAYFLPERKSSSKRIEHRVRE